MTFPNDLSFNQTFGDLVVQKTTDSRHFTNLAGLQAAEAETAANRSFSETLMAQFNTANNLLQTSVDKVNQAAYDYNSASAHEVMIAMQQANLSLMTVKAVTDGAIRAYREIINLR